MTVGISDFCTGCFGPGTAVFLRQSVECDPENPSADGSIWLPRGLNPERSTGSRAGIVASKADVMMPWAAAPQVSH